MSTQTQICNAVLTLIGSERINSIDEETQSAQDLKAIYDLVAKQVMALGPWPSTCKRAALAQLVETPAFKYSFYYQLPSDCLRVLEVDESLPGDIDFDIEGGKIATNEDSFSIKYTAFISDAMNYDPWLETSMVEHLSAYLVYKQSGDRRAFLGAMVEAKKSALRLISYASAQGGSKDTNLDGDYITARS